LKVFVGITDFDWFEFLSRIPNIDEVNFWQPSGTHVFRALTAGEPFLFKLHSPNNYIVGGGFFAHSTILPVSLTWDVFGEKNGADSIEKMRKRIEKYRRKMTPSAEDYQIGCILLEQPFFFHRNEWIPVPSDWKPNIVSGKGYDTSGELGKKLWNEIQLRLQAKTNLISDITKVAEETPRYGDPIAVSPRLGQGSFRIIVTDAYHRRCAITQERTLPALEASHIKPFSESGPQQVQNGILFRSDIHRLFDAGYVTISPDRRFEASRRIREEFENGRDYYALNGKLLHFPQDKQLWPDPKFITWHNKYVFRG